MSTGVTGVKKVDRLREHKRVLHFGSEVSNTMRTHIRGVKIGSQGVTLGHYRSNINGDLYLHRKAIISESNISLRILPSSSTLPSKLGH